MEHVPTASPDAPENLTEEAPCQATFGTWHAQYFVLQLAESSLTSTLFRQTLGRIERLAWHPT